MKQRGAHFQELVVKFLLSELQTGNCDAVIKKRALGKWLKVDAD